MDKQKILDLARERCSEYRKVAYPAYRFDAKDMFRFAKKIENATLDRVSRMLDLRGEPVLADAVQKMKHRGRFY